jgi:L-fuconolactonase
MIDAHVHFWSPSEGRNAWLEEESATLNRSRLPHDLEACAARHGIAGLVVVQSAADAGEAGWLARLPAVGPPILGIVAWLDLSAADPPCWIAALRAVDRRICGVRALNRDATAPALADPALDRLFGAIADAGLVLDALAGAGGIADIVARAERTPGLAIVLDHAGDPPDDLAGWRHDLARLAARPGTWCKLSGLLRPGEGGAARDRTGAIFATLLALFGPGRLIWGSDWPVVDLSLGYDGWLDLCRTLAAPLGDRERAALFGGSAAAAYRLAPAS